MANTTDALNIYLDLAAFDALYAQEFLKAKIDPPGLEVTVDQIYRRDGKLLGNLQDDLVRRVVSSVARRSFDNRQAIAADLREPLGVTLLTVGPIANAGGVGDFTIPARIASGTLEWLRLVSTGGLSANVILELFVDAARTELAYQASGVDPSVAYVEGTPVTLIGNVTGANLEARTLYGRITNNGGASSVFELEAVIKGI